MTGRVPGWLLWGAVACGKPGSNPGLDSAEATAPTADSAAPLEPHCVDAPQVTWDSWGAGFLGENCQACHRTTSTDRHGAPEDVHFDDRETTLSLAERILARSTGSDATMPPGGGVSDEDRYKLHVWLTCWE